MVITSSKGEQGIVMLLKCGKRQPYCLSIIFSTLQFQFYVLLITVVFMLIFIAHLLKINTFLDANIAVVFTSQRDPPKL